MILRYVDGGIPLRHHSFSGKVPEGSGLGRWFWSMFQARLQNVPDLEGSGLGMQVRGQVPDEGVQDFKFRVRFRTKFWKVPVLVY